MTASINSPNGAYARPSSPGRPSVGYHDCACRDCFELYVGEPGEFCSECEDAGCEPDHECRASGAYGCEEEATAEQAAQFQESEYDSTDYSAIPGEGEVVTEDEP